MENPNHNKWRFIAGKIIYFYGQFSMAMLNSQRVNIFTYHNKWWYIYIYVHYITFHCHCNTLHCIHFKYMYIYILIGGFNPPEKYESQIGSSSQLLGKIKFMFQTTNQISPLVSSIKCGGPRGNQRNSKRRFLIAGKIIPGWGIFPQPQQATGRSTPKRAMGIWRSYDDKKWYNKTYIYIFGGWHIIRQASQY